MILTKNMEYIVLGILSIANAISIFHIDSISIMAAICSSFVVILLFSLQVIFDKILNKDEWGKI